MSDKVPRATQLTSVKIQSDNPAAVLAGFKIFSDRGFDVRITTGVRPADHANPKGHFDFDFYGFALVSFDLTPGGRAIPTQRAAIQAFKEGKRPP